MSGSAYKIVKDRAYHHGTMLISSQLGTLGDVLHVSKVRGNWILMLHWYARGTDGWSQDSMVTRGVASVRSPVKNLREFSPPITHNTFVKSMVQAFREEYRVKEPVCPCHKSIRSANFLGQVQYVQASDAANSPYIQNGIAELHVKTLSPIMGLISC